MPENELRDVNAINQCNVGRTLVFFIFHNTNVNISLYFIYSLEQLNCLVEW